MNRRVALHVGDVAGVGADLARAINESVDGWDVLSIATSQTAASHHGPRRLAMLPARLVSTIWRVRREIRRTKPDVVHLHGARWTPIVLGLDRVTVVHAHGTDVRGRRETPLGRVIDRTLRSADLLIAATPDLVEHLPDGARVLANPVDTDTFVPLASNHTSRRSSTVVVFAFARLSPIKGAASIVAAASALSDHDIRIVALSGGPLDAKARAAGIELLPPLDRPGIVRQLQASDLVIGQQHLGVLGRSEYEALSTGVPVIMALDEDQYGDRPPPVVVANTPSEIVESVRRLAADPERRAEIGKQGRSFVEATCSMAASAKTITSWYQELL